MSQVSQDPSRPGDRVIAAGFLAGAKGLEQFPPPVRSELAFAGRSNVGKSSLMNLLLQRNGLVRTSSTPGCTRQVSWFSAKCDDGAEFELVDLPGYGYAKRSKSERIAWGGLIDGYLLSRVTLRGVALLVDVRRGLEEEEFALLELLEQPPTVSRPKMDVVIVATKLDKLSRSAHKPRMAELQAQAKRPVYGVSAESKEGRLKLWRKLRRMAGLDLLVEPAVSQSAEPR